MSKMNIMLEEIQRRDWIFYMRDNLVRQENWLWKIPDCDSKFEKITVDIKRMEIAQNLFQYKN